jgi:hypothetical protein
MAADPQKTHATVKKNEYDTALKQIGKIDLNKEGASAEHPEEPKLSFKTKKRLKASDKKTKEGLEYEADAENDGKKIRFRDRLILGEANFSYTKSVIKKHENDFPELPKFITATEIRDQKTLTDKYEDFEENVKYIQSKNGKVLLGVDATNLQQLQQREFPDKHFERIHFNAPYLSNAPQTRSLVRNFFASAKEIQKEGDRIYISLVDKKASRQKDTYFWHGETYGIIEASAQAGYKLLKKRKFDESRYAGYKHRETDKDDSSINAKFLKEFVFEKTNLSSEEIKKIYAKSEKILSERTEDRLGTFSFFAKNNCNHTIYDTSDDSSDYFTKEGTDQGPKMGRSPT